MLLDVPKHCKEDFVTQEKPIHGWELEDIVKSEGITLEPGDPICVYGSQDKWDEVNPTWSSDPNGHPGLHASCLKFLREADCCLVVWDMMGFAPNGYDLRWSVHGAIFLYGIGLLDYALLQPLYEACSKENRYEFMPTVNPLGVIGRTGSPVNPIALR